MRLLPFVAALAAFVCAAHAQAHTVIHAGTLIVDPRQAPLSEHSVIVSGDGTITAIEPGYSEADPDAHMVIDLKDAVVLPGLIDMHTHILFELGPRNKIEAIEMSDVDVAMRAVIYARRTLEAGFTTVRNLGGSPQAVYGLRDAIAAGHVAGPRIVAAGSGVSPTGSHADIDGVREDIADLFASPTICDGPYECRGAVREAVKRGADVIKVTATGGVLSDTATGLGQQIKHDELLEIISTAHSLGRKVAAHAHGPDGINAALEAGVDSIEHGSMLNEESIRLFKTTGAYLVPTLLAGRTVVEKIEAEDFLPPAIKAKALALEPEVMKTVQAAYEAGVKIAFGTDSGVSKHGDNAREFLRMRELGMTNAEMLTTATVNAAELLGMADRLGTLEAGKQADIIAVETNPLDDIEALLDVGFVMKGGMVAKSGH